MGLSPVRYINDSLFFFFPQCGIQHLHVYSQQISPSRVSLSHIEPTPPRVSLFTNQRVLCVQELHQMQLYSKSHPHSLPKSDQTRKDQDTRLSGS